MAVKTRQIKRVRHWFCNYWTLSIRADGGYDLSLDNTERVDRSLSKYKYKLDIGNITGRITFYRKGKKSDEIHRKILLTSVMSSLDTEISRLQDYKDKLTRLL